MSLDVKSDVLVLGPEAGETTELFGNRVEVMVDGAQSGGAFGLLHVQLRGNQPLPPLHRHGFDEVLYVLGGTLTVRTEREIVRAGAGSTVFVPRGVAHTIGTPDESPATFVAMVLPAGFEHIFAELAALVAAPDGPDPEAALELTRRYGVETLEEAMPH